MIDDYAQAMALIHLMEAHLPIPARPMSALVQAMRQRGATIARGQEVLIQRVFYLGDEGGISCDVTPPGLEHTPVIASLTHLRVGARHPLGAAMRLYQQTRKRKLAQAGRQSALFSIQPGQTHRRE